MNCARHKLKPYLGEFQYYKRENGRQYPRQRKKGPVTRVTTVVFKARAASIYQS
jgi:hypothetical protein